MNMDSWGEVINGPETYHEIAVALGRGESLLVGWADGRGTHHDMTFAMVDQKHGRISALHPATRGIMLVGVFYRSVFGFELYDDKPLHPDYVAEKLRITGTDESFALAVLLNGIKSAYTGNHYETPHRQETESDRGGDASNFDLQFATHPRKDEIFSGQG